MTPPVLTLCTADAGELLTLQRAAYVGEAQSHRDPWLPPLVQTLDELTDELTSPAVRAWGVRANGRLIGAVRVRLHGPAAVLGRLIVAPDRQREGLGTFLLWHAERALPDPVDSVELFTGEHSHANLRLYMRNGYRETHRAATGDYELVHFAKQLLPATPLSVGHLRRAESADLAALADLLDDRAAWLRRQGIDYQWPSPFPRHQVEADIAAGNAWVVLRDGEVIAAFTITTRDPLWTDAADDVVYLHRLAVRPGNPGLGAELIARVGTQFAHAGKRALRLDTVSGNGKLRAYYRRAGFVECGTRTVYGSPRDGWPQGSSAQVQLCERPLP